MAKVCGIISIYHRIEYKINTDIEYYKVKV